MQVTRIKLDRLKLDFQNAECLFEERVLEIMSEIASGQPLQPITVRFDGKSYFLQDGFHRVEAATRCGLMELDAEIQPGSLENMESEWRAVIETMKSQLRP